MRKNKGSAYVLCFIGVIFVCLTISYIGQLIGHSIACKTAKNTIVAVNGHVVFWQYSAYKNDGSNPYLARHFVWPADKIQGVNLEDDGIDINIYGQISDTNIYGITPDEFNVVLNQAKKQLEEWKKISLTQPSK